ncbi:3-oxoacyl-(acyl-carrier-protein) synthase 2 [Anaeromyxobacter dehalogenans 2CP-1]|uniref:3-oxoacyl-[acyl-carrier-protein] synthase 2 n=1 Tax=Anaeromyxobacter dehalogenans (strain ATCC BAA-258 / DSM 21875 / 2CP-1) TaxID=455488 RepID=B8JEX1_ANAD2|nr:beta-ketoacyl-ACP synthase II [Anaeromyxobacter dehalogenans]ACL66267.1 3-oxoacyl-(acyl-carrier-protein) synthase 2 [Anaeromyxobacter dehalogenans 2CP-1]
MSRRRVVVTGLGLVSPVGIGVEESWSALVAGKSGIGPITLFDASTYPTRIAGEVKAFDPTRFMDRKEARRNDRFIQFALAAADMAMKDSGLDMSKEDPVRVGAIVGAGIGGLGTIEDEHKTLLEKGVRKIGPFFIPSLIINLAPGQISMKYGMQGPNFSPVSACATGNHSIGDAMLYIERGLADVIIAGGCEATITPLGIGGFCAARALSERNDAPEKASRPFDKGRDGFVAGEGAGLVVLEEYEHARKRGARIYAELAGYGASADAYHITAPAEGGEGGARAVRMALQDAGVAPEQVGYVNTHGTSTPVGDVAECQGIKRVFGEHAKHGLMVSSTKSMTGHLLGGAGGLEAVVTVLAISRGVLPPTINVEDQDPQCDLDVVPNTAREVRVDVAVSNSFGFGGTNAVVLFKRV